MNNVTVRIEGVSPLLMHNGQLADPLNENSRSIGQAIKMAKKNKTEASWETAYKAEFLGGLYLDEKEEPCLPGEVLEAMIAEAARKTKQGKQISAGVIVDGNFALDYEGPHTAEKLWHARYYKIASARIGKARVMRVRPMFLKWGCTFVVHFNHDLINERDLISFISRAGAEVGVGDYRPRYGRFVLVNQ